MHIEMHIYQVGLWIFYVEIDSLLQASPDLVRQAFSPAGLQHVEIQERALL